MTVVGDELRAGLSLGASAVSDYAKNLRASARSLNGPEVLDQIIGG